MDSALFQENERTQPEAQDRKTAQVGAMVLESGAELDDVKVVYETWGNPSHPAILVCHALSGDSHAVGWWDRLIGPGKAIDTNRFFVVCSNALGGCQGTTGPQDFAPYGSRFPQVTVGDMVDAQALLADRLGVEKWHTVAGGSMGGMQALEWSVRHPQRVERCFATASCAAHSAMQIGFNEAGRQAIRRDPRWRGGDYPLDDAPKDGLSVARMLGHLSFLSDTAFSAKFGRRRQEGKEHLFQVESYLNYQSDKFTGRFDANSLLVLTRAIDDWALTSMESAECRYFFVSYTSDWLYPSGQSQTLLKMARSAGREADWLEIDLPHGHDAFLLDGEIQGEALRKFLESE
ncbi:homoserine O-acetyltransferase [bacterium]|nr:MAG: homoserine O-acetyltransferase [bacterium]